MERLKRSALFPLLGILVIISCSPVFGQKDPYGRPTSAEPSSKEAREDHAQIEKVIRGAIEALNNKGKGLEELYLPDASSAFFGPISLGPKLSREVNLGESKMEVVQTGVVTGDEYVKTLVACLAEQEPVAVFANPDLQIRTYGPLGFATLTGVNVTEGSKEARPWRWTLVLEKVHDSSEGRWAVVHDHFSF